MKKYTYFACNKIQTFLPQIIPFHRIFLIIKILKEFYFIFYKRVKEF